MWARRICSRGVAPRLIRPRLAWAPRRGWHRAGWFARWHSSLGRRGRQRGRGCWCRRLVSPLGGPAGDRNGIDFRERQPHWTGGQGGEEGVNRGGLGGGAQFGAGIWQQGDLDGGAFVGAGTAQDFAAEGNLALGGDLEVEGRWASVRHFGRATTRFSGLVGALDCQREIHAAVLAPAWAWWRGATAHNVTRLRPAC